MTFYPKKIADDLARARGELQTAEKQLTEAREHFTKLIAERDEGDWDGRITADYAQRVTDTLTAIASLSAEIAKGTGRLANDQSEAVDASLREHGEAPEEETGSMPDSATDDTRRLRMLDSMESDLDIAAKWLRGMAADTDAMRGRALQIDPGMECSDIDGAVSALSGTLHAAAYLAREAWLATHMCAANERREGWAS